MCQLFVLFCFVLLLRYFNIFWTHICILFLIFIVFIHVPGCSGTLRDVPERCGMFRNVPCSGFYRRPLLGVAQKVFAIVNSNFDLETKSAFLKKDKSDKTTGLREKNMSKLWRTRTRKRKQSKSWQSINRLDIYKGVSKTWLNLVRCKTLNLLFWQWTFSCNSWFSW